jgi:kynurenine formamidase
MAGTGKKQVPVTDVTLTIGDESFAVLADQAIDISIPLDFHGDQPSHFGAPPASATALKSGGFTGDTRAGGSCNCETLTITPHCNGTHTECVGHVTGERISVSRLALDPLISTALVSVEPVLAEDSGETSEPPAEKGDRFVTAAALGLALQRLHGVPVDALLIRTTPNGTDKTRRNYSEPPIPPYLSHEAASLLVSWDIRHLLTDLPSIDRSHDQGILAGHRLFWGLEPGEQDAGNARRPEATITEMAYVPDTVADGLYALSLQIAPFVTDAAPSRPVLYPLEAREALIFS